MLKIENINTYYYSRHILWDLSLHVPEGSIVAMLGRNGMGKTTIMRSIVGLTPPRDGAIHFKGERISGLEPYNISKKGVGYVPQGRGIFASLSVKENLTVAARGQGGEDAWTLERVYDFFPILKERESFHANLLSGGEQQMLAIGRALMTNPELLIMDEPSEGLAPLVIKQIGEVIGRLKNKLTVFLVEQNFNMALSVSDYIYIVSKGSIVHECTPDALRYDEEVKQKWLGV
ncbi:MAG: ABC transporter ATP-binding protein [Clostridiales Family XIII bacterium]|nr:ABC transporter ATP-binding protein [Clostridiales Family XIII bacterium]